MAIQTLHDTGSSYDIPSQYDGGVYATGISDCICKGIGDEFTLTYYTDSLQVQFSEGSQAVIGGSFFRVESLESITLASNSTIYLCANINLANPNGSRGSFVQRTSSNMQSDNINGSGTSRDLLLYIVTTGASGVTSVQDKRIIRGDGTAISGLGMTLSSTQLAVADTSNSFTQTLSGNAYNVSNGSTNYNQSLSSTALAVASGSNSFNVTTGANAISVTNGSNTFSATINGTQFNVAKGSNTFNFTLGSKALDVTNASYSLKFKVLTETQYNALSSKDANTLYFVYEG